MANQFQTKQFKKLFQTWNRRLERSGFEDVEDFKQPEPLLRRWTNTRMSHFTQDEVEDLKVYFARAREVLLTHKFKNKQERRIWELHSEGFFDKEIARELKITRHRAVTTVRRIKDANGIV